MMQSFSTQKVQSKRNLYLQDRLSTMWMFTKNWRKGPSVCKRRSPPQECSIVTMLAATPLYTSEFLAKHNMATLSQPARIKIALKGHCLDGNGTIQAAVTIALDKIPVEAFQASYHNCEFSYTKCADVWGVFLKTSKDLTISIFIHFFMKTLALLFDPTLYVSSK